MQDEHIHIVEDIYGSIFYSVEVPIAIRSETVTSNITFNSTRKHMNWCYQNCKGRFFNMCDDYSSIVLKEKEDAIQFVLAFHEFMNEQEKILFLLRWT